jgi:hypothetical protein
MSSFNDLVGKTINKIHMDPSKEQIVFETSRGNFAYFAAGDCCSTSWFEHLDGVDALIGGTISSVDDIEQSEIGEAFETLLIKLGLSTEKADDAGHECIQKYFFKFTTDKGRASLDMRNSSNGYYGGYVVPQAQDIDMAGFSTVTSDF